MDQLAQVTARVNAAGEEYRSGRTQTASARRKLKQAIKAKVELQEKLRVQN